MNEMIERVARALLAFDYQDQEGQGDWLDMEWESKSHAYLAQARAAIVSMREPTSAMIDAGDDVAGTLAITHDSNAELTWERMIDAALGEPGEKS